MSFSSLTAGHEDCERKYFNNIIHVYEVEFYFSLQNKVCVCYNMKVSCLIKLFNFPTEI